MNRRLMDIWVGVFVVVGFAALLFLALRVSSVASSNLGETYLLKAKFDNIGGLKARGPVKSAGVVVGRVTGISLDPEDYEAVVTMKIDGRYRFPKDTYASILTSGLLGEQYVGLDAGGDEKMLNPGETFARTQSAIVLEKLVGQFLFNKAAEGVDKK